MDFILFGKAFRGDKVIWCVFIALCLVSLLEVFSATSTIAYRQQSHWAPMIRHSVFLLLGFGVVLFMQRVPPRFFSVFLLGAIVSAILLVFTKSMGESVNGAQRFLGIGAFTIQPSEFAKISAVGATAFLLSRINKENKNTLFWVIVGGVGILCALIAPENLSTALLLCLVCFLMMFVAQVEIKKLAMIVGAGFVVIFMILGILTLLPDSTTDNVLGRLDTWTARIERHSGEEEVLDAATYKITDDNFQVTHAKIAIANGGVVGLPGSGVQRDFLPQAYSDFIFAIILEEMGLLGGLGVILLYVVLMIRCGVLARKSEKKFPRYLILGCALMLTIQALVNMAVAVNLIPVTGQPLPLISRGGTSTIITCAYFGIILACSSRQNVIEHAEVDESLANIDFGIAENE